MSKRGNRKDEFAKFKEKISKKRRKEETTANSEMEYITVQRLSSHVKGKYQKYARIGALASVTLGREPTIQNIREPSKRYFDVGDGICCDVLAGERGPSWTETSQRYCMFVLSKQVIVNYAMQIPRNPYQETSPINVK